MKSDYTRVIGIDVAAETLEVFDPSGNMDSEVENSVEAIRDEIVAKISSAKKTLVVCEATGGYESALVEAMHDAGVDVAAVNPRQVRDFAKGHGHFEKSDQIDARMIRKFGTDVEFYLTSPKSERAKKHQAFSRRRSQLMQSLCAEQNRLRQSCNTTRPLVQEMIKCLKKQLKEVDHQLEKMLSLLSKEDSKVNVIQSCAGVVPVMTSVLLCELPELGTVNRAKIAKLVGVAPIKNQSGKSDRKRPVRGGRAVVRTVLYMATLAATRHNQEIKRFYQRLVQNGKPKKLAMVAAMRKLLTILNEMVRHNEPWHERPVAQQNKAAEILN